MPFVAKGHWLKLFGRKRWLTGLIVGLLFLLGLNKVKVSINAFTKQIPSFAKSPQQPQQCYRIERNR
jgi:hypothetical protein